MDSLLCSLCLDLPLQDLHELHAHQRTTDAQTDAHIEFMVKKAGIFGISDHNLLFSKTQAVESSSTAKELAKRYMPTVTLRLPFEHHSDITSVLASLCRAVLTLHTRHTRDREEHSNQQEEETATQGRKKKGDRETYDATPIRRRPPRESIVDTPLNAFTPPVTVYSRVIERTPRRGLNSKDTNVTFVGASPASLSKATPNTKKASSSHRKENAKPRYNNVLC